MNPKYWSSWDLVAIIFLSGLLILSILLIPDFWLRMIIGLPFLLFFPGYALISFLFPEKKSLDIIERVTLSFGLSIAITPLIGLSFSHGSSKTLSEVFFTCVPPGHGGSSQGR